MRPYIEKYLPELCESIEGKNLIMKQYKLHFIAWLKELNIPIGETPEEDLFVDCWSTQCD
jgi:hypothetical protein